MLATNWLIWRGRSVLINALVRKKLSGQRVGTFSTESAKCGAFCAFGPDIKAARDVSENRPGRIATLSK